MTDVKAIQAERTKLYEDVYRGIVPKRIPMASGLSLDAAIQWAGLDLGETLWTNKGLAEALDHLCQVVPGDVLPAGGIEKNPAVFKMLGSRGYEMSSSGYMQHRDVVSLQAAEYDEFSKNPYDFIVEKSLPRIFSALDTDPTTRSIIMAKAVKAFYDYSAQVNAIRGALTQKYGFFAPPAGSASLCQANFDFIGDFLRGVKEIFMDVKQCPEKVAEACEAMLPVAVKRGTVPVKSILGKVFMPLHLATYLRPKDFENIFWPSFSKFIYKMSEQGQSCSLFCEDNWTRYVDYLYELPENTVLMFEFGDPKLIKEKLGKKHVLTGFYPITYLKTATKQQCVDKAKELIDILAPGGRYIFGFDKSAISLDSINMENYIAVMEYVYENGKYDNPGDVVKDANATEKTYKVDIPAFESKHYTQWSQESKSTIETRLAHIVNPTLQAYEEQVLRMIFTIV